MSRWILAGLGAGIKTTTFPKRRDEEAEVAPTKVVFEPTALTADEAIGAAELCPTSAIRVRGTVSEGRIVFDLGQCTMCGVCVRALPGAFSFSTDPNVAVRAREGFRLSGRWKDSQAVVAEDLAEPAAKLHALSRRVFGHSLHIRHVDAGSCNGCESELQLLTSPHYDFHRLGFCFTATPRHADCLLVTGVVSRQMELALRQTWEAMPWPKVVVAAGVCAIGGGIFEGGPMTYGPLDEVIPVDIYIPGCPPSPLALLHGLLLAVGRTKDRLQTPGDFRGA